MTWFELKKPSTVGAVLGLISPDKRTVLREAEVAYDLYASLLKHFVSLGKRCQEVLVAMRYSHHETENCPCRFLSSVSFRKVGERLYPLA